MLALLEGTHSTKHETSMLSGCGCSFSDGASGGAFCRTWCSRPRDGKPFSHRRTRHEAKTHHSTLKTWASSFFKVIGTDNGKKDSSSEPPLAQGGGGCKKLCLSGGRENRLGRGSFAWQERIFHASDNTNFETLKQAGGREEGTFWLIASRGGTRVLRKELAMKFSNQTWWVCLYRLYFLSPTTKSDQKIKGR